MKFSIKSRIVFLSACFVFAAMAQAWAADPSMAAPSVAAPSVAAPSVADIDGKWVGQVPGRGGQTRETTFTFKAEGDKLTGTVSGMQGDNPISDGKIAGDEISFKVKLSFQGNEFTFVYKGKVAGDEIKFTRAREGGDQPPAEFTAKRVK